ncbi:MAG: hypothetical protein GX626_03130 [Spirochaetales bacterium]|nr:hypothetical protein [Spirochaetales bacterium]
MSTSLTMSALPPNTCIRSSTRPTFLAISVSSHTDPYSRLRSFLVYAGLPGLYLLFSSSNRHRSQPSGKTKASQLSLA